MTQKTAKKKFLRISKRVKNGLNRKGITEQDILKDFESKKKQD